MKKIIALLLVFLTCTGCIRKLCVEGSDDGSLKRTPGIKDLTADKVLGKTREIVQRKTGFEVSIKKVGHQLGNYKEYPKFPGDIIYRDFRAVKQMNYCFDTLNIDGVEIDIQLGPDGAAYIVHEKITDEYPGADKDWDLEKDFYISNSLEVFLRNYIESKRYQEEKYIFIELKAKKAYSALKDEIRTVDVIFETFKRILSDNKEADEIRKHISFVSFNHLLLYHIIKKRSNSSDSELKLHKLYYIAAADRCNGKIARLFCPELNDPDELFVRKRGDAAHSILWDMLYSGKINNHNDGINGIWFSLSYIENAASRFHRVNVMRMKNNLTQLEFYLSTYQTDFSEYKKQLDIKDQNSQLFYKNIKGLIFDFRN